MATEARKRGVELQSELDHFLASQMQRLRESSETAPAAALADHDALLGRARAALESAIRDRDVAMQRWEERVQRWQGEVERLEAGVVEAKAALEHEDEPARRKPRARRSTGAAPSGTRKRRKPVKE